MKPLIERLKEYEGWLPLDVRIAIEEQDDTDLYKVMRLKLAACLIIDKQNALAKEEKVFLNEFKDLLP